MKENEYHSALYLVSLEKQKFINSKGNQRLIILKGSFTLKIDKHFYGDKFCMLVHTFACYLIRFT